MKIRTCHSNVNSIWPHPCALDCVFFSPFVTIFFPDDSLSTLPVLLISPVQECLFSNLPIAFPHVPDLGNNGTRVSIILEECIQ